jgi:RNA polymerase sigma factor (sigma-70 family)
MTNPVSIDDWIADYGDMVLSLCLKVIKNRELALDASQAVWETVLKKRHSFRNESSPGTWIYRIAFREALRTDRSDKTKRYRDILRAYHAEALQPRMEADPTNDAQLRDWLSGNCDACLSGIIGTLNFKTRIIVVFKYILNVPFEEISRILGMEQGAVRQAASRGMRRLARFFRDECGLYANEAHCKCGLEKHLGKTSFKREMAALKSIAAKAHRLHELGNPLPPIGYWEKIRAACHKEAATSL